MDYSELLFIFTYKMIDAVSQGAKPCIARKKIIHNKTCIPNIIALFI